MQKHPLLQQFLMRLFWSFIFIFGLVACQQLANTEIAAKQNTGNAANKSAKAPQKTPRQTYKADQLYDFGDPNFDDFLAKLKNSKNERLHIVQLGDSHTAADIFTGQLRLNFQAKFGNGGIGLIMPGAFSGIRNDVVKINESASWKRFSMKNPEGQRFSFTGYLSMALDEKGFINIVNRNEDNADYEVSLLYKSAREARANLNDEANAFLNSTGNEWAFSEMIGQSKLPLALNVENRGDFLLGGALIANKKKAGVMLSTFGVNGATLMDWDKWSPNWQGSFTALAPDLVILAYGTNEAFAPLLDVADYQLRLKKAIADIRQSLPDATILIVGAPDSLRRAAQKGKKKAAFDCKMQRPPMLNEIISLQREIARSEKTLFWDWQEYMGGACAIRAWNQKGLARDDLVHFSADGYRQSANALYKALQTMSAK